MYKALVQTSALKINELINKALSEYPYIYTYVLHIYIYTHVAKAEYNKMPSVKNSSMAFTVFFQYDIYDVASKT